MAGTEESTPSATISTTSYDTALCVISPPSQSGHVDRLRELYHKAHGKWPPHVNLIYPFVAPEHLPRAQKQIQKYFDDQQDASEPRTAKLERAGHFNHRTNSVVYICESTRGSKSHLDSLRLKALQALGQPRTQANLHLTIGESEDNSESSREFLLAKARLLPKLEFDVGALAILVRERGLDSTYHMRLWGVINISSSTDVWRPQTPEFWLRNTTLSLPRSYAEEDNDEEGESDHQEEKVFSREVQPGTTYYFDSDNDQWTACTGEEVNDLDLTNLTVSSYNVLIDSEYPPARDRDSLLVRTILEDSAMANILVLQEVSDDFLSYLLCDGEVQRRYPFTSHAPPCQPEIGPLPSLRNIVVLSAFPFSWKLIPFHRRHKGALVARFRGLTQSGDCGTDDLIVAGVHLTCGLTDGSVAAKKIQLSNLTNYLTRHHSAEPWIIAGDFNITTSSYTIDTALKNKSISGQTAATLNMIESHISDKGLLDAWAVARVDAADDTHANQDDDLFEGEEGATFDPRNNILAAATSGTSNNRPQRYDRILVRPQGALRIAHFNHFGRPQDIDGVSEVASDHSGVRANFRVLEQTAESLSHGQDTLAELIVKHKRASAALSDSSNLNTVLANHNMFPTPEEVAQRQDAFTLLKNAVLGASDGDDSISSEVPLVIVPVGSYALGVWTSASDIDCLCIGSISSKTFFKLARQRLIKAESQGVRILRKVEANTGTMLELSINGVAMDLQYCPAARVVERWSEIRNLPASDPIFNLSMLSLRKLKPYRDLLYIMRTIPSFPVFRIAYRCIKLWAIQRGIYSSRFGYLSGIHITLMLSWVCKRVAHDSGSVSAADLVASFFHHYAQFDWANEMLYDGFFHKKKPRYHRTAREPMVVLGFHAPNSNVAHTSTVPGTQILAEEFKLAYERLSEPGMTWEGFFGSIESPTDVHAGALGFLKSHNSYVKIDIQFWGRTLAKGKGLVGWVESRCLSLVVDIHKAFPALKVRIWPARFTASDSSDPSETSDYHGCYLIGLTQSTTTDPASKEDKALAKQSLDKVLDRFLTQMRSDDKNYDPNTAWLNASLAKPSETRSLRPDTREWGDYAADPEPDSDDDEDLDSDDTDDVPPPTQRAIPQRPKPTPTPLSTSKLRPASDVLNRLRWDPSLDPAEYIIGYEDRFLGAKETGLERWKTEQTDEEFIPQHRILYFKRRGVEGREEVVVWERATRVDRVFGSGVGDGEGGVKG